MSVTFSMQLWLTPQNQTFLMIARTGILIVAMLICCIVLPAGLLGADEEKTDAEDAQSWHISADSIQYDQTANEYVATGNVSVSREGRTLTLPVATYSLAV